MHCKEINGNQADSTVGMVMLDFLQRPTQQCLSDLNKGCLAAEKGCALPLGGRMYFVTYVCFS